MKMSPEDRVDDETNMDEDEHVWKYVEIWGALTNIHTLFGYDSETMTTALISAITDDMFIEIIMNGGGITRQEAESRWTTKVLLPFIDDIMLNKISSIDEVLMNWKREQLRKKQAQSTTRRSIEPYARADINCLLVELEQLTRGY